MPCRIVKSLDEFRVRPNLNRIIFKEPIFIPSRFFTKPEKPCKETEDVKRNPTEKTRPSK